MIKIGSVRYSLMLLFAISLHYLWGIGLLADPESINATALIVFKNLFDIGPHSLALLVWLAASMALISAITPFNRYTIGLALPQQFTMMVSAYGAISAMATGHFGDGVPRPVGFIMNDQMGVVLAAVFHTLAIIGRINEID